MGEIYWDTMTRKVECGTLGGYKKHTRDNTEKCEACKAVKSAQDKKYYEKNRQKILDHAKVYREQNGDDINARRRKAWKRYKPRHDAYVKRNYDTIRAKEKAYYAANRDKILTVKKEYQKKNADQIRAKKKLWQSANRESINAKKREYDKQNREMVNGIRRRADRKRRALIAGNGAERYTEQQLLNLYGTNCHICGGEIDLKANRQTGRPGWEKALHIDHVIPIIKGGPDTIDNVRPAHAKCNVAKGGKILGNQEMAS
jgi:5-methylcytosine-specific restriction endonuclease McrA